MIYKLSWDLLFIAVTASWSQISAALSGHEHEFRDSQCLPTGCPSSYSCKETPGIFCLNVTLLTPTTNQFHCKVDGTPGPLCMKAPEKPPNLRLKDQQLTPDESMVNVVLRWETEPLPFPVIIAAEARGISPYGVAHTFTNYRYRRNVSEKDMIHDFTLPGSCKFNVSMVIGNALGNTGMAGPVSFTTPQTVPSLPADLKWIRSETGVNVSFKCPAHTGGAVTNVVIQQLSSIGGNDTTTEYNVPTHGGCLSSIDVTHLVEPGPKYRFRVKLKNAKLYGNYSEKSAVFVLDDDYNLACRTREAMVLICLMLLMAFAQTL